jgi:signal transduction histidine kinase
MESCHLVSMYSLDHARAEQLRLEEKISQLGEEERQHLGREIHDGLCQQLTAALLRCTALAERLKSHETDAAAQAQRLRLLIQEMLDAAYVISKGVWPVGPEPDDLVPALQLLATRTAEEFGLICDFRHKGDTTVANGQMAMHLYRIAQEAVNNSVKHARASRVSLLIEGNAGGIVLKVTDDGCGGMDGGSPGGGMGLDIMAYRARTMGGTLTIAHTEGGGTEVCCTVPRARVESLEGACDGK